MKILLAPTERLLKQLLGNDAITSTMCEEMGADILIMTAQGTLGIQRKEIPHDFLLSVQDGRLARETTLLRDTCDFKVILQEGKWKFFPNGSVATGAPRDVQKNVYDRFTRKSIQKIINEIRFIKNCDVDIVDDTASTIEYIRTMFEFMNEPNHSGLSRRPKVQGVWGKASAKEEQLWVLQGFPGIGPGLSQKIIDRFNVLPLKWACTYDELCSIQGIGEGRADKLWKTLPMSSDM